MVGHGARRGGSPCVVRASRHEPLRPRQGDLAVGLHGSGRGRRSERLAGGSAPAPGAGGGGAAGGADRCGRGGHGCVHATVGVVDGALWPIPGIGLDPHLCRVCSCRVRAVLEPSRAVASPGPRARCQRGHRCGLPGDAGHARRFRLEHDHRRARQRPLHGCPRQLQPGGGAPRDRDAGAGLLAGDRAVAPAARGCGRGDGARGVGIVDLWQPGRMDCSGGRGQRGHARRPEVRPAVAGCSGDPAGHRGSGECGHRGNGARAER